MPWSSSDRKYRLPEDWPYRRSFVLRRDGYRCQLGLAGCLEAANEVDHIVRGDDHSAENLQAVCIICHAKKSSAEGNAMQQRLRAQRFRPSVRHPGRL